MARLLQRRAALVMRAKLEATKDRTEQARAVAVYLDVVSVLHLSACTDDFAAAFRDYLASWRKFADLMADPRTDTKPEAEEIDRRWETVLVLARSHRAVK